MRGTDVEPQAKWADLLRGNRAGESASLQSAPFGTCKLGLSVPCYDPPSQRRQLRTPLPACKLAKIVNSVLVALTRRGLSGRATGKISARKMGSTVRGPFLGCPANDHAAMDRSPYPLQQGWQLATPQVRRAPRAPCYGRLATDASRVEPGPEAYTGSWKTVDPLHRILRCGGLPGLPVLIRSLKRRHAREGPREDVY